MYKPLKNPQHTTLGIGVRAGGGGCEGGCSPPSYEKFWNFSGKTLVIRAKVFGRKYSKRRGQSQTWRLLSLRIQEKPYIVDMCIVEISRDGGPSSNKTMTESKQTKT